MIPADIADAILATSVAALTSPPARRFVTIGSPVPEITEGDCTEQLAVQIGRVSIVTRFPSVADLTVEPSTDLVTLGAPFSVWITRCFPAVGDGGQPPSAARITAASKGLVAEGWTILWALINAYRAGTLVGTDCDRASFSGVDLTEPSGGVASAVVRLFTDVTP